MILWFLRLFLDFRALEIDLAKAREACSAEAEEREDTERMLEVLTRDRDKLWELVTEAQKGERYALQSQANILSQRSGGGVPYPDAHQINNPTLTQEGGPVSGGNRILPSQRAERAREAAIQDIVMRDIAPMFK